MEPDLDRLTPEQFEAYLEKSQRQAGVYCRRITRQIQKILERVRTKMESEESDPLQAYEFLVRIIEDLRSKDPDWRHQETLDDIRRADRAAKGYRRGSFSRTLTRRVFERDQYRCVVCGTHLNLTVDHIIPLSRGGTNDFSNLQTLCSSDNSSKGTWMPEKLGSGL